MRSPQHTTNIEIFIIFSIVWPCFVSLIWTLVSSWSTPCSNAPCSQPPRPGWLPTSLESSGPGTKPRSQTCWSQQRKIRSKRRPRGVRIWRRRSWSNVLCNQTLGPWVLDYLECWCLPSILDPSIRPRYQHARQWWQGWQPQPPPPRRIDRKTTEL